MNPARTILAVLCLGLATAAAQEPKTAAAPVRMFDIRSGDPRTAMTLAALFGIVDATEESVRDKVLDVAWDPVQKQRIAQLVPAEGAMPPGTRIAFDLDVAATLTGYATEVEELRRKLEPAVDVAFQQLDYPIGFGRRTLDGLLGALLDIERLEVRIRGDLNGTAGSGLVAEALPHCTKDSGLARWLGAMKRGKGTLPVDDENAVSVRCSLAPEGLSAFLAPLAGFQVDRGARNASDREANRAGLATFLAAWNGNLSLLASAEGYAVFLGLRDAAKFAAAMVDPERLSRLADEALRQDREVEHEPRHLVHRDVAVMRTRSTALGTSGALPGEIVSYAAVLKDSAIYTGATKADPVPVTQLVDLALDGRLGAAPLPDDLVLDLQLDVARILSLLPAAAVGAIEKPPVQHARLAIRNRDGTVTFLLELR